MTLLRWVRVIVVLSVGLLSSGCTVVLVGLAHPAAGMKPRPLTGEAIKQVLLDGAALSAIFNQGFKNDSSAPEFEGRHHLRSAYGPATPVDCAGVTTVLEKSAYRSAAIKDLTWQSLWHDGESAKVISVTEGVVALPTAADAQALFAEFAAQWNQCDGTTLTLHGDKLSFVDQISDVRVANSVLAATVSVRSDFRGLGGFAMPETRAIGVRVNCLVEVEIAFYGSLRETGDLNSSVINIAHLMMDKVSDKS